MIVLRNIFYAFTVIATSVCGVSARSADRDDIYAVAYVGSRLVKEFRPQVGGVIGWVPIDSWGVGFYYDYSQSLDSTDSELSSVRSGVEGRMFVEPFEVSAALGLRWLNERGTTQTALSPMFILGADYLWALTPSIAARFEMRLEVPVKDEASVIFAGLGGRFLF